MPARRRCRRGLCRGEHEGGADRVACAGGVYPCAAQQHGGHQVAGFDSGPRPGDGRSAAGRVTHSTLPLTPFAGNQCWNETVSGPRAGVRGRAQTPNSREGLSQARAEALGLGDMAAVPNEAERKTAAGRQREQLQNRSKRLPAPESLYGGRMATLREMRAMDSDGLTPTAKLIVHRVAALWGGDPEGIMGRGDAADIVTVAAAGVLTVHVLS